MQIVKDYNVKDVTDESILADIELAVEIFCPGATLTSIKDIGEIKRNDILIGTLKHGLGDNRRVYIIAGEFSNRSSDGNKVIPKTNIRDRIFYFKPIFCNETLEIFDKHNVPLSTHPYNGTKAIGINQSSLDNGYSILFRVNLNEKN